MARKDMIKELEKFKQRACSTSPSKTEKYHNLNCNNFERNEKLKKYFQTQSQNSPQKLNSLSYFEDSRQQIFSSQKFHENNFQRLNSVKPTIQPKFPQLKNQKTESNEIDRQNSELMNTSINQNFQECSSPKRDRIQNQKYYQPNKCTLQRNKFLNDSYRLYGFVTEIKDQKQKYSTLHVSNFINLNKSSEQNNNANSSKSRELTPQDKTMKKSRSSKDKLQNLLKQSHLKHLERHFRIPAKNINLQKAGRI